MYRSGLLYNYIHMPLGHGSDTGTGMGHGEGHGDGFSVPFLSNVINWITGQVTCPPVPSIGEIFRRDVR